jgi:hypothetical protein
MTENYPQFVIESKKYSKNTSLIVFLMIFWVIWSSGSILVSTKLLEEFSLMLLIFFVASLVITLGIPAWLFSMNKKELVTIIDDKICIHGGFVQFGEQCVHKSSIAALVLSKEGASFSLMMIQKRGIKPHSVPIAPFVGLKDKMYLQKDLASFLQNNGCNIAVINNTK